VIPGASKPSRVAEDHAALATQIPDEFWHDLRTWGLVSPEAPLPTDSWRGKEGTMASAAATVELQVDPDTVGSSSADLVPCLTGFHRSPSVISGTVAASAG